MGLYMSTVKTTTLGKQEIAAGIYFVDDLGEHIHPIYQKDNDTGRKSYRVYMGGGNTKDVDIKITNDHELAKHLIDGYSVRCRVPSGDSSNRSLHSTDVVKLVVELEK